MSEIQTIRDALNARKPDQMTTAWVQYADAISALDALEKLLPPEGETRGDKYRPMAEYILGHNGECPSGGHGWPACDKDCPFFDNSCDYENLLKRVAIWLHELPLSPAPSSEKALRGRKPGIGDVVAWQSDSPKGEVIGPFTPDYDEAVKGRITVARIIVLMRAEQVQALLASSPAPEAPKE